ncbi:hypothetical protein ON003_08320 [Janibacter hoylei]|uniref:hypothetical protein n=1 Tax=Janibacter hoylei TaxID=364298 RepID=UPI00223901C8|nr:hypothetical protein [Janibacter hoylei]MCW4601595.1 hypothetical protein [Janibacter hoylei]
MAATAAQDVTDRRRDPGGRGDGEEGGAPLRLAGREAAQERSGGEGDDEAADAHAQAGDRVVELVVARAVLTVGGGVLALPPELETHGPDVRGDGEDGQVGACHGGSFAVGERN